MEGRTKWDQSINMCLNLLGSEASTSKTVWKWRLPLPTRPPAMGRWQRSLSIFSDDRKRRRCRNPRRQFNDRYQRGLWWRTSALDLSTDHCILPLTRFAEMCQGYGVQPSLEINHNGQDSQFEKTGRHQLCRKSLVWKRNRVSRAQG